MSARHPRSVPEWREHLGGLEGDALRSKAIAANTASFVRLLQSEGYGAEDIHSILILLARRFRDTGQNPPGDGLYDLETLMATPLPGEG